VGLSASSHDVRQIDEAVLAPWVNDIRQAYVISGLRGANQLARDLARSAEAVAGAAGSAGKVSATLDAIAAGALSLLGTDVSYVTLVRGDGTRDIVAFREIRTSDFRHLRSHGHQGLGGLALEERRPVISFNYLEDERLVDPTLAETSREGLVSAICAPLVVDSDILGFVYAANRHLTSFSQTDSALLAEFARIATAGIRLAEAEGYRDAVERQAERERLAFELHDSVVRSLIEIGFEADHATREGIEPDLQRRLERIGNAAAAALDQIRELLSEISDPDGELVALGEVLERLRCARVREQTPRSFSLHGSRASSTITSDVAAALFVIGTESLQNAELHSGAQQIDITLHADEDRIMLSVLDDGCGLGDGSMTHPAELAGHLGLRRMDEAARHVGGRLRLQPREGGGLCVEAEIPVRRS
jgi:signal transduction histidine kinase